MMYDIASSKYKQLCQIRKINNDNLEVTENEKPNEWEPKGRRMIQWSLTDGVQDITAIEYMPLKQVTVRFFFIVTFFITKISLFDLANYLAQC